MSIKDKLQAFGEELIADANKKSEELHRLKREVDYLIEQGRKEITAESNKLDAGFKLLANEKERFEKYKIKTEKEIEEERESAEARIDRHFDDVIGYLEELHEYGKPPQIIDSYINACFVLDEKLAKYYLKKQRPNHNTAEDIRNLRKENKAYLQRIKELEYLISERWPEDVDTSEKRNLSV